MKSRVLVVFFVVFAVALWQGAFLPVFGASNNDVSYSKLPKSGSGKMTFVFGGVKKVGDNVQCEDLLSVDEGLISEKVCVPLKEADPFLAIGSSWKFGGDEEKSPLIFLKSSIDGVSWNEWFVVGVESVEGKKTFGELVFLDRETKYIQCRIDFRLKNYTPKIVELDLFFISPGATPEDVLSKIKRESGTTSVDQSVPQYVNRTGWLCEDGSASSQWNPQTTNITHIAIHHTANNNNQTDWSAIVRAIWKDHAKLKGWGDIGYNWLIDPNGVIYQGRSWLINGDDSPKDVVGGHLSEKNDYSIGVAMLGNFMTVTPTECALSRLKTLLAWKCQQKDIDPLGTTYFQPFDKNVKNILGHRDVSPPAPYTDCPGDCLHSILPSIRNDVKNILDSTLSISFYASSQFGVAPLTVNLSASINGPVVLSPTNFTFWWDCNNPTYSVSCGSSGCGNPWNSNVGAKFDGVWLNAKTVSHTYATPGTYYAKVIVERGLATPVERRIKIDVLSTNSQHTYFMPRGINSISFPFTPIGPGGTSKFSDIFSGVGELFPAVFYYDGGGRVFANWFSDSTCPDAEAKRGYFLIANSDFSKTIFGTGGVDPLVQLPCQNWNCVGVVSSCYPEQDPKIYPKGFYIRGGVGYEINLTSASLNPGIGYMAYAFSSGVTFVSGASGVSLGANESDITPKESGEGFSFPEVESLKSLLDVGSDFSIEIRSHQDGNGSGSAPNDKIVCLGVKPESTDGFDSFCDAPIDPPVVEDMIFYSLNDGSWVKNDYRQESSMALWTIDVISQGERLGYQDNLNPITLSWNFYDYNINPATKFSLRDVSSGSDVVSDMRLWSQYQFPISEPGTSKRFTVLASSSPVPPEIIPIPFGLRGPSARRVGEECIFRVNQNPQTSHGHNTEILFDWGDGSISGWLSWNILLSSHSWNEPGIYSVKAKSRCLYDYLESDWSLSLSVNIGTDKIKGDVNLNEVVDDDDLSLIRKYLMGYQLPQNLNFSLVNADTNGDGLVNATDLVAILKKSLPLKGFSSGDVFSSDSIVGNLRFVSKGRFLQGSPITEIGRNVGEGNEDQFPHLISRNLAVMETEVTKKMWADLKSIQPTLPNDPSLSFTGQNEDCPVNNVLWRETILFSNLLSLSQGFERCYFTNSTKSVPITASNYMTSSIYCDFSSNGFRLPSEGEWEYFCRAGTFGPFSVFEPNYNSSNFSDCSLSSQLESLLNVSWFCQPGATKNFQVGQKEPNFWGIKDSHGNVGEWVFDGRTTYPINQVSDYFVSSSSRIIRGGSASSKSGGCRSAYRWYAHESWNGGDVGFRLVRTIF